MPNALTYSIFLSLNFLTNSLTSGTILLYSSRASFINARLSKPVMSEFIGVLVFPEAEFKQFSLSVEAKIKIGGQN